MGAIILCLGVLAALVARQQQGVGQRVDSSHLGSNMWLQGNGINMTLLSGGSRFASYDRAKPVNPLSNLYKCGDGSWVQFMMVQPDRYWKSFATAMGLSDLIDDPRFATTEAKSENSAELVAILDRQFASKPFEEWDRAFRESGDFIYSKVQRIEELEHDPQVIANDYITTFDHPVLGPVKMVNHPVTYSETPAGIWREAPELGQHTEEILIDELGYSWEDIQRLKTAGAIL